MNKQKQAPFKTKLLSDDETNRNGAEQNGTEQNDIEPNGLSQGHKNAAEKDEDVAEQSFERPKEIGEREKVTR